MATRRGLFEKVLENPPPTTADAELIKKATSEVKNNHTTDDKEYY